MLLLFTIDVKGACYPSLCVCSWPEIRRIKCLAIAWNRPPFVPVVALRHGQGWLLEEDPDSALGTALGTQELGIAPVA